MMISDERETQRFPRGGDQQGGVMPISTNHRRMMSAITQINVRGGSRREGYPSASSAL